MQTATENNAVQAPKITSRTKKKAIFFALIVTPFLLHLAVFYFYVNIETFILAFQKYTYSTGSMSMEVHFAGVSNFITAFKWLTAESTYYTNMLINYAVKFTIGYVLTLFFSYYIYKRLPMSGFFKYMLYLPHILSALLMSLLYKLLIGNVYQEIMLNWFGKDVAFLDNVISSPQIVRLFVIIFYSTLTGFGVNSLVYSSTMDGIDPSLVESAHLDGANLLQEFWLLTMPMIWKTFMTFVMVTLTGIFTDQMGLFNFYGSQAEGDIQVIGYKMYIGALHADLVYKNSGVGSVITYSGLSAAGLMITAVLTPIVLTTRHLMTKYGPSAS